MRLAERPHDLKLTVPSPGHRHLASEHIDWRLVGDFDPYGMEAWQDRLGELAQVAGAL